MTHRSSLRPLLTATALAGIACPLCAIAQSAPPDAAPGLQSGKLEQIVVTAQKRSQSINEVPIAITALSGAALAQRGVTQTADLGKVVSGFVYTPATFGEPVYTLRGVGLYDSGVASSPAVSVYVDQVPLPFSIETLGAALDVQRVEVLKGPQGTLFGQNNTGGAINFIAAKPTRRFEAGIDVTYERFDKKTVNAYVSGAITPDLLARVAFQAVGGGAWQKSITRPGDQLGNSRDVIGRLLLHWTPNDRFKTDFNFNAYSDRSDTQASQLQAVDPEGSAVYPQFLVVPHAQQNAQSADWDPGEQERRNNHFLQASVNSEYKLTDNIRLTSISSFADMHIYSFVDLDGSALNDSSFATYGRIQTFNQELRLSGSMDRLNWTAGATYEHAKADDNNQSYTDLLSINDPLPFLPPFNKTFSSLQQNSNSYAIFGNIDYKVLPRLTFQAGARATQTDQTSSACTRDFTTGNPVDTLFTILEGAFAAPGSTIVPITGTNCYVLNPLENFRPGAFNQKLDEGNISYRSSLTYKLGLDTNIYASVSRGFKAGIFTNVGAALTTQFLPVKQERLDAYEIGLKTPLLDDHVRLDIAGFYYSYTDKQLRARIATPEFGLLETLVTVPKSKIYGIDADLTYRPFEGLTLGIAGTYLNSYVVGNFTQSDGQQVYDEAGQSGNFKNSPLSYTPKLTGNLNADYIWPVTPSLNANFGSSLSYRSTDNASLESQAGGIDNDFKIRAYALLDLRAGISAANDRWTLQLFGRNVTNRYYWTTVFQSVDERHRYAGLPATYGITLGYKFF